MNQHAIRTESCIFRFILFWPLNFEDGIRTLFYSTVQLWPHQCRLHFFTRNVLLNSPQSTISSLCYMPRTKYVTDRVNKINRSLYLYWVLSYWGMFHQCSGKLGKPVIGCLVFGFWFLMTGCLGSKISWSSRDFLCDVSSFFISQKNWKLIWFTILKKTRYWRPCIVVTWSRTLQTTHSSAQGIVFKLINQNLFWCHPSWYSTQLN